MNEQIVNKKSPLFCKPEKSDSWGHESRPGHEPRLLFSKEVPEIYGTISFRSLNLKEDLAMIHEWVQKHYAQEYWQMTGPFSQFYANYQCMELNPYSHSFIGLLDEQVICQFDVYSVIADELREHISYEDHDCGFHLLMSPIKNPIPGLTVCIVKAFLGYYFSFTEAQRMYAEPDVNNEKSIILLERCGFEKIKTVQMSYKTAHVYCLERQGSSLRSE